MVKLSKFLKPFLLLVSITTLFLFVQAMAELYLPTTMADVVNQGMLKGDVDYIYFAGGKMLSIAFISSFSAIFTSFLTSKIAMGVGRDIRNSVFERVENYSLHEFDQIGTASLITRTTNDITQIQQLLVVGFRFLLYSPIMCVGGLIMAISKDKMLALVLTVAIPALVISMAVIAKAVYPLFQITQKRIDRLNLVMRESLTGIRVIRAFNKTAYEKKRFETANRDLTDVAIRANRIMACMHPAMVVIMDLTSVSIVWFGGLRISQGKMGVGDMMAFIQYAMQIITSVIMVSIMYVVVPRAQASAKRVNDVLELSPGTNDPLTPDTTASDKKGTLQFENVTFFYPGAESPVIKNISFLAKQGEVTAIIGGTGSGKSTLINLIPRFYDATEGRILVDGADIRGMSQYDLREKIGFVPQEAVLFSGSVYDNISFGNKSATDEEVYHAAEVAQAYEFISDMPEGFDSVISQGGANISGGQRQRLSIARAIVRRPAIYIFDDSFSAIDFKTDARLRLALKKETKNSILLIVAQRITTIIDADQIIVLDEGEIVGKGVHNELMKNCEVYREIIYSQLSEEEIA